MVVIEFSVVRGQFHLTNGTGQTYGDGIGETALGNLNKKARSVSDPRERYECSQDAPRDGRLALGNERPGEGGPGGDLRFELPSAHIAN